MKFCSGVWVHVRGSWYRSPRVSQIVDRRAFCRLLKFFSDTGYVVYPLSDSSVHDRINESTHEGSKIAPSFRCESRFRRRLDIL